MALDIRVIQAAKAKPARKETQGLGTLLRRDFSFTGNKWNDKKKERFYSELYVLLTAGIDIRTALELLEAEAEKKEESGGRQGG